MIKFLTVFFVQLFPYKQKNNTHDGEYTVHNGLFDINRFTRIEKWGDKRLAIKFD